MVHNKLVKISRTAYTTLLNHATAYASATIPQDEWKIVYGLLCGSVQGEDTHLYDAIPLTHGTYAAVDLSVEDYIAIINCLCRN